MKSAQFIHIETYSKKSAKKKDKASLNHSSDNRETNVSGVLNEARRVEGFTSHIESVKQPELLYGCSIDDLEVLIDEYYDNSFTVDKNGKQKKLRTDASIVLAGVISLKRDDMELWDDYKKESIKYLKEKYGDNLKTVIEHTDESNPHIHFYVVADYRKNENLNNFHDGKLAVSNLPKEEKKNQNSVYVKAMTDFQDDFYFKVSNKFGFDRLGRKPKKRMSKHEYDQYLKEKSIAYEILEEKNQEIQNLDKIVVEARTEASTEGFNEGFEKGLEKSSKVAEVFKNVIEKLRFTKTDLEIQLENELSTLKNRFSNLVKRKNMYKKKSIDAESNYKRIRDKYQKTDEFKEELKQHQMKVKISQNGSPAGSGIAEPAPNPTPKPSGVVPTAQPSATSPKKPKL